MSVKKRIKKVVNKNPWFRKRLGNLKGDWGFVPINWEGFVSLVLLVGLNIFAANYFNLNDLVVDNYLKMGVVFLLSVFVFIEIAKKKTIGVK
ncbi:hypothetical protein K8R30_04485 [archaeon]|nr:hypothetical protein [archaeon]